MEEERSRYDEPKSGMTDEMKKDIKKFFHNGYMEKGKLSEYDLDALRSKYKTDDMLHKLQTKMRESEKKINRKIEKFAKYLFDNTDKKTLGDILHKALKYKHKLTDYEFDEFYRIIQKKLTTGDYGDVEDRESLPPQTRLSEFLGSSREVDYAPKKLKVEPKDLPILGDILKEYNRMVHSDVQLNALAYSDCEEQALNGQYNKDKHNVNNHIHPVLFAMFVPKIEHFERNMIYSSFYSIIKTLKEGEKFKTISDASLHFNITNSLEDIVCDADSVVADLRGRARIQNKLWDCVLKLRSGLYYDAKSSSEFLLELDNCKLNNYDSPDLLYTQDETSIMRKIMAVFGDRPTWVRTYTPQGSAKTLARLSPYGARREINQGSRSIIFAKIKKNEPLSLQNSLHTTQWYLENNSLVPREQVVVESSEVLIFCVPRREKILRQNQYRLTYENRHHNLPLTILSDVSINSTEISVEPVISIAQSGTSPTYELKSVVGVNMLVVPGSDPTKVSYRAHGSFALVKDNNGQCFSYDPRLPAYSGTVLDPTGTPGTPGTPFKSANAPVSEIDEYNDIYTSADLADKSDTDAFSAPGFYNTASKFGTVFIYVSTKSLRK